MQQKKEDIDFVATPDTHQENQKENQKNHHPK